MRFLKGISVVLMLGVAHTAWAQEGQYSQTLDEQLQRVQHGEPAVPAAQPVAAKASVQEASPAAGADVVGGFTRRHNDLTELGSGAIPALPLEVQNNNGISYITGGIGDEEEAELKAKGPDFNVHVLLTSTGGDYISEVMVRVLDGKDQSKQVMESDSTGPYFFVSLPAGNYVIEATAKEGGIKKIKVHVPAKGIVKDQIVFQE